MSFALGIEYLNGWALATHPADREQPEWPPHPDRVFMALAAAHFETDGDAAERRALEWLESLGPPVVFASDCGRRTTVTTFVPVNDEKSPIKKGKALMPSGSLPIGRDRQPRQFPVAIPHDPTAFLAWDRAEPDEETRARLAELSTKVTSVGHSASFVRMWTTDPISAEAARLRRLEPVRAGGARFRLRVFGPGRLSRLKEDYDIGLRPVPSRWQGYEVSVPSVPDPAIAHSAFSQDLIVLRHVAGKRFGLESTLLLTAALRNAVMKASPDQPPPEWINGHQANGTASEDTHLAFVPLPHIGHRHADGRLLGLALAVPRSVSPRDAGRILNPLLFDDQGRPKPVKLTFGRWGECELEVDEQQDFRVALKPEIWTAADAPSCRWATVTPIALDRHAKGSDPWSEVSEIIADGCQRINLPRPSDVVPAPVSMFVGAPTTRDMPRIERKRDGGLIRQVHAIISFPEPIIGPVLIGAGRYRGYGLCRPLRMEELDS